MMGHQRAGFVAGDALHLPFGQGMFDLVACQYLVQPLCAPAAALGEMRRVCREGDHAVFPVAFYFAGLGRSSAAPLLGTRS